MRRDLPRVCVFVVIINTKRFGLPPSKLMAGVHFYLKIGNGVLLVLANVKCEKWYVSSSSSHISFQLQTLEQTLACLVISDNDGESVCQNETCQPGSLS